MGMVEFVGLIKVNIVKGTNLAVRDMMTSDPYVILNLGHQARNLFLLISIFAVLDCPSCIEHLSFQFVVTVNENTRDKEQFEPCME